MFGFPFVQGASAFGGQRHHFVIGQPVIGLPLHPAGELDPLALRQAGEGVFHLSNRAHGGKAGKTGAPGKAFSWLEES